MSGTRGVSKEVLRAMESRPPRLSASAVGGTRFVSCIFYPSVGIYLFPFIFYLSSLFVYPSAWI
jgi:hypothetical protein